MVGAEADAMDFTCGGTGSSGLSRGRACRTRSEQATRDAVRRQNRNFAGSRPTCRMARRKFHVWAATDVGVVSHANLKMARGVSG